MIFKPHDYQKYCIDKIVNEPYVGLFLAMGLGKTVTTLTAVHELKYNRLQVGRVLIIAPKKVAEGTWLQEAEKWDHTKGLRVVPVLGSLSKRQKALQTNADIYVINRENVTWLVDYLRSGWFFDMVVIDESSAFKSPESKRFKSIKAVRPLVRRMVLLTGTPSPNGIQDLWAQIYLLDGGKRLYDSFYAFRAVYMVPDQRSYQGQIYSYRAKPDAYDKIMKLISDICVSMKAEDYLQLPDVSDNMINVILDSKAQKAYDTLEAEAVLELFGKDGDPEEEISAMSAAALSNKLLQLANGAVYDENHEAHKIHDCKLEAFLELIEGLQGQPVLVFYNFQHDRDRIKEALKKSKLEIRELKTVQDQQDWNDRKINVLLAHPASAAYGLNLQQGGNHVVWFGLTWNYELYMQANKRLHRQGQTEKVIVHHLVCKGTRDEDVIKALTAKDDMQQYVMDSLKARIKEVQQKCRKK